MNSIVCIKRVPDSEARIRVAADGSSIDPSGVKFDMNEYDKYAIEEALRRREAAGEGVVTVITVGG
ncbi:MAG: electron transfer flavoprotein subunit beta, partial [Gemmatimonadota bacterium]